MRPKYSTPLRGKGRLRPSTWHVARLGGDEMPGGGYMFVAERTDAGLHETVTFKAHCEACAKVFILQHSRGKVDTRSAHNQGECGAKLLKLQPPRRYKPRLDRPATGVCPQCGSTKLRQGRTNLWCDACGFYPIPIGDTDKEA